MLCVSTYLDSYMTAATPKVESYTCTFPGCPRPVKVSLTLIAQLEHSLDGQAQTDQQGLLFGRFNPDCTQVESSRPVTAFADDAFAKALDAVGRNVVGYYRIRDGSKLELNNDEMLLGERLFSQQGSIILLIQRRSGTSEANLFFQD